MTDEKLPAQTQETAIISTLVELRNRYETEQKDYLKISYQYFNFYTGFIIAILGVTIITIVQATPGQIRNIVMISGPILAILLSVLGFATVKVFYRRFIEAWVTLRNIEEMLGNEQEMIMKQINRKPLFQSKHGGFIARFERSQIEEIIRDSQSKGQLAEEVVERITETGDVLSYLKKTFIIFIVISILLIIAVVFLI